MFCPKCGKETAGNPTYCPGCGARLSEGPAAKKTGFSTVAGILDIIDGSLKLLGVFGLTIVIIGILIGDEERNALAILLAIAIPLAVLGILAMAGGISALQKKSWGMALAGAIAAVLPFSLLGIAALILTALSRDEFK